MTAPFYAAGLRWSCRRCSDCCRHDSGYVFLSQHDADQLAEFLALPFTQFIQVYCRWVAWNGEIELLSLKETSNNDCFFWKDGCQVYDARPAQCRTYPFWKGLLTDETAWNEAAASCSGIGKGTLHSQKEIESCLEIEDHETPLARRMYN
ncbi:MAG: YkgJ family cysteine cluster protein [Spirochaetaceae bacterium]|jgi:Fe-S-cluster containining protein|nr:YkgJ family cysteine cluster protein [Spirochaetaceae bacterium]